MTPLFNNNGFPPALVIPVLAVRAHAGYSAGRKSGFTLIELLVVVLIIGILAAVALPQYQKAVEKSRGVQALTLLKSVYQAAKTYRLANGDWPKTLDELSLDIPWTNHTPWYQIGAYQNPLSNSEWSLQLIYSENTGYGVSIGRLSGPYQGVAFEIYDKRPDSAKTDTIYCLEASGRLYVQHRFTKSRGAYCQQIFRATGINTLNAGVDYFVFNG